MVVVGCGIIESLLHYLLIADGSHASTEWELVGVAPGNPKNLDGEKRKVDSHIYRRIDPPRIEEMTFDSMLKKAERRRVLGREHNIYPVLKRLRPLRNKVHLQEIGDVTDTDWNAFNWSEACAMAQVLRRVFRSSVFSPTAEERRYFGYLDRYEET